MKCWRKAPLKPLWLSLFYQSLRPAKWASPRSSTNYVVQMSWLPFTAGFPTPQKWTTLFKLSKKRTPSLHFVSANFFPCGTRYLFHFHQTNPSSTNSLHHPRPLHLFIYHSVKNKLNLVTQPKSPWNFTGNSTQPKQKMLSSQRCLRLSHNFNVFIKV